MAKFFEVLGRALAAWQSVEAVTYLIYERAVAPARPGAAAAGFHQIQTYQMKLQVTDHAVRYAILEHGSLTDEWDALRKRADDRSKRRNDFAHLSTWTYFNEAHPNNRVALGPALFDTRPSLKPDQQPPKLGAVEIAQITETFKKLAADQAAPSKAARSESVIGIPRQRTAPVTSGVDNRRT